MFKNAGMRSDFRWCPRVEPTPSKLSLLAPLSNKAFIEFSQKIASCNRRTQQAPIGAAISDLSGSLRSSKMGRINNAS